MLKNKNILNKETGVTLVSLVVTIIILIILSAISINAIIGDDGIIEKAELEKERRESEVESDLTEIEDLKQQIEEEPEENVGITLQKAKKDSMLERKVNTKIRIGNEVVWMPAGFKVHEDSAETVNEGIIITDAITNGNEFVWVPVSNESFDEMFNPLETPVTLTGTTGVTSSYYSNLRVRSGESYTKTNITEGKYTTTDLREPDLLTNYDEDTTNKYYEQAGYTSPTSMAQGFVNDYTNLRGSIEKYGGFYIGRYELTGTTETPEVKSSEVLTGNWYELYKASRNVAKGNKKATSTMIWGCQWDETMNWLKNTKFKNNISAVDLDSTTWGNYKNVSVKADDGTTEIKASGTAALLKTGITTYTMANNIYDLAGNGEEWTQEAYLTTSRICRGFNMNYTNAQASGRRDVNLEGTESEATTRVTLYLNVE